MNDDVPGTWWLGDDGLHVDTRGLPPPEPMVAVLWHIGRPGQRGPVIVHLDRDPIYLLPELAERGWTHEHSAGDTGVTLILRAAP